MLKYGRVGCPEFVHSLSRTISDPYTTGGGTRPSMLAQRIDVSLAVTTPLSAGTFTALNSKLVDPAVHVVTAATQELDLLGLRNTRATTDSLLR